MNYSLPARVHTQIYLGYKQEAGGIIAPVPFSFSPILGDSLSSFEYPQYPRHILQLAALVLILIPGKPPQIAPICSLVHIPGPLWYPAAKPEPVYEEGRRLQVLFH